MRILYIGEPQTHEKYLKGIVPSHWLYGACEMEADGHEIIWEKENSTLNNDLRLVRKYHPDIVFIPNLNLHNHILLLILSTLCLYHKPIYAYLHHAPQKLTGFKAILYRLLFGGLKHIFFLSSLTMSEMVENQLIKKKNCSIPEWGRDRLFFDKISIDDQGYFISTGKENRDFDILIEAFKKVGAPLIIMTAKSHLDSNYENLKERCKDIPNIQILINENSGDVYPQMLKAMANAKALVCPLRRDRLTYCVGLSTITDAEALHKPLIITRNPYHDKERIKDFHVVETVEDWINAINDISSKKYPTSFLDSPVSIQEAYKNMKKKMFL